MTIPLQFVSLYGRQEVFVWSSCLLDLGMKITIPESSPHVGLFVRFSLDVLVRANKMQIMTISIASEAH